MIPILILAIAVFVGWTTGLVDFTYEHPVPNEPLQHPRKVQISNETNMLLENGGLITFWPSWRSEEQFKVVYEDASNMVRYSDFQVDIETNETGKLEIFVRRPRKLRDFHAPLEIPIIRENVGMYLKRKVAFGTWVQIGNKTNSN